MVARDEQRDCAPTFQLSFHKMEGCGNDYIYVVLDEQESPEAVDFLRAHAGDVAILVADRHFGIGGDGLVLVDRDDDCDARMIMFNRDGSRSSMCGNALRCIAKLVGDRQPERVDISIATDETRVAVRVTRGDDGAVHAASVDMGAPILDLDRIPFVAGPSARLCAAAESDAHGATRLAEVEIDVCDLTLRASVVSFGNPHCVVFIDDVEALAPFAETDLVGLDVVAIGVALEGHACFPLGVNVEFVAIAADGSHCLQRTWERGSGETKACGSGACATALAAALRRGSGPRARTVDGAHVVRLIGGDLSIAIGDATGGAVRMSGPARHVFAGVFTLRHVPTGRYDGFSIATTPVRGPASCC